MTHHQLVIRGDWRGFALCLEPAGVIVDGFRTLTGVSRAMEKGDAVLRAVKGCTQPVPAAKSESHNHSEGGRDVS